MKGLQFFGNRVEDAANAFIDVLKYSDQSVDYPDFKDIEPWPDEPPPVISSFPLPSGKGWAVMMRDICQAACS